MKSLDALLEEEKGILADPSIVLTTVPKDDPTYQANVDFERRMFDLLPYLKYQPFVKWICSRGRISLLEHGHDELWDFTLEPYQIDFLLNSERKRESRAAQDVTEALKGIETKYSIAITPADVETYLIGLAGRILDYVKRHLAGYFEELREDIRPHFRPNIFVLHDVRRIRAFYEQAIAGSSVNA